MNHIDWDKVMPDVPDKFHRAVLDALDKVEAPKRISKRRIVLLAVAAILLLGTTALAAMQALGVLDVFENRGIPVDEGIQELAQLPALIGIEETLPKRGDLTREITDKWPHLPTEDALIRLTELVYDGKGIYAVFTNSEAGKGFDFSMNVIYVNGAEHSFDGGNEWLDAEGNRYYYFDADVSDLSLDSDFDLAIPLSVYKGDQRYWGQHLTYRIIAPETSNGQSLVPPEKLRLVNHDVIFNTIYRGTITTDISFSYRFSQWKDAPEKDLLALANTYCDFVAHDVYTLDGEPITIGEVQVNREKIDNEWIVAYSFSLLDLPKNQSIIHIIPSRYSETPDGKWSLDEVLADEAFTINLPPAP